MMDTKYYYWAGGAALVVVAWLFLRRAPAQAVSEDKQQPVANSPQPIFVSGSGGNPVNQQPGGAGANIPLGGQTWLPPTVPLSENPDVAIAKLQAEMVKAQQAGQLEVTKQWLELQKPVAPSNPVKRASMGEAVDYLGQFINKPGGISNRDAVVIADKAREFGFSAQEVGAALNIATNSTNYSGSFVNNYLSKLGVAKLPEPATVQ